MGGRASRRRYFLMFAGALALYGALGGSGSGRAPAGPGEVAPIASVSTTASVSLSAGIALTLPPGMTDAIKQLDYTVNTRYGATPAACAGAMQKPWPSQIGVPRLIDVNGELPDLSVALVAAPDLGTGADTVELVVKNLALTELYVEVEVVVTPDAASPERIAFGYNACEFGAPIEFNATVGGADKTIAFLSASTLPTTALTLIGSTFDDSNGNRANAMTVAARMAPMPTLMSLLLTDAGDGAYHTEARTLQPTEMKLDYSDVTAKGTTKATALLRSFPGQLIADFSAIRLEYAVAGPLGIKLSSPIGLLDFSLETTAPSRPTSELRTDKLRAVLTGVPAKGRLDRLSKTQVEFSVLEGGEIGAATLTFSSAPATGSAPALPAAPAGEQFLVARSDPTASAGRVRVTGLSHALIDSGDEKQGVSADGETDKVPLIVDATHTAGPFRIDAATTRPSASGEEQYGQKITRAVTGAVLDLPATARVEFGGKTQSFSYFGSAPIERMEVHVTSNLPFTDDATAAHLLVENFPTGLSGRMDEVGKKFRAAVTGGAVGKLELQVTSGPDVRLPVADTDGAPLDGVLVEDHDGAYSAFARIKGLSRVEVGWGDVQLADVVHTRGRFKVDVDVDDPDSATITSPATDIDLVLAVKEMPGTARFAYTPAKKLDPQCVGDGCAKAPSDLLFNGNADVSLVTADIKSGQQLIDGGEKGWVGAHELHAKIKNIPAGATAAPGGQEPPPSLHVAVDGTNKTLSAQLGSKRDDFVLEIEACKVQVCGAAPLTYLAPANDPADPSVDGLWLTDREDHYHLVGRVTGLRSLDLSWADTVKLVATKKPGQFDAVIVEDKLWKNPLVPSLTTRYESRTALVVGDLPATVDLTYSDAAKQVIYKGAAPISALEAWHSVDPIRFSTQTQIHLPFPPGAVQTITSDTIGNAIAGRATVAHVKVAALPQNVNMTFHFTESDFEADVLEVATAPTTPGAPQPTVGDIRIELASSESVLNSPHVRTLPIMTSEDGLVMWDLDDNDSTKLEPFQDPFLIAAHVTALRQFRTEAANTDASNSYRTFKLDRDSRNNLSLDIRKYGSGEQAVALPGWGPAYRMKTKLLQVDVPPKKMEAVLELVNKKDGDLRTANLRYHAAELEQANSLTFVAAGQKKVTTIVAPVPASPNGNFAEPGVGVCFSPKSLDCNADHQSGYADEGFVSAKLEAAAPVGIDVEIKASGLFGETYGVLEKAAHLDIASFLQFSYELDTDYCNEHMIYLDTKNANVSGSYKDYTNSNLTSTGGTSKDVFLPYGTSANKRWVRLIGPPCKDEIYTYNVGNQPRGTMVCPEGMNVIVDAFEDIDVHIEDEICPEPRIKKVEDDAEQPFAISRSGQLGESAGAVYGGRPSFRKNVHIRGAGFAPGSCWVVTEDPADVTHEDGTFHTAGTVHDQNTCSTPDVAILLDFGGNIHIVSGAFLDVGHIVLTVDVETDTPVAGYGIKVDNPETGSDTCWSCFKVVQ